MSFRPGPLRAALALAVGFVAVRVVYRVLFHGVDGTGAVLLPLPVWPLAPPLAHVRMFGPVTADGLTAAVVGALPIALTILAFGMFSALLDLPRLLARGARRGPFQGLARALSIAWATLPALADAARTARRAQRLRGERGFGAGVRILAPVLEATIERATAVGASLELRGYAGRRIEGDCRSPIAHGPLALGFGDDTVVTIDGSSVGADAVSDGIRSGSLTVLTGATGSGKTTLLRALSGLHTHLDGGWLDGGLSIAGHDRADTPPRDLSRLVGVVLQNPRVGFVTTNVRDEIGLALELRGLARLLVDERVRDVAGRVGAAELLDRPLRELSAGQATLVAIAAAIIEQPLLLLVDEPLADLDRTARSRIVTLLGALAHEAGMCVIVAEHRGAELAGVADVWLHLTAASAATPATVTTRPAPFTTPEFPPPLPVEGPSRAATATDLRSCEPALSTRVTVRYGQRLAVDDVAVTLHPGEVVALVGPNGAGKSSLLVALATGAHARDVRLVPDDADALFVRDTVAAECRRADRRAHLPVGTTIARVAALLGRGERARLLGPRHPRDLSAGQRRCLALAIQTAARPRVLLVDEPTRGLDHDARRMVDTAVTRIAAAGTAVLVATHDSVVISRADVVLGMDAGRLSATGTASAAPATAPGEDRGATHRPRTELLHSASTPPSEAATTVEPDEIGGVRNTRAQTTARAPRPRPALTVALVAANVVAAAAFLWPLAATALPAQAQAAVGPIALALAPLAMLTVLAALDTTVRSAQTLALLAVLAAIGAAVRIASTGVGGVEALFVLLILAGRAYGARFGLLLGAASVGLSALLWGGVGPWLPFQMFACAWVAAGAGLLPRRVRGGAEIAMLVGYGAAAAYAFGLIMNMWFWPFAVGAGTSISYVPGAPLPQNLGAFLVYSLVTSTLSWDTVRALTTIIGICLVGRAVLRSLRRAKPVAAASPHGPGARPRSALATVES
ncbi:putative HMP/thiamine import ATP-binding protein YkoD [Microbacterium laevaniformans]|uniref:Putative HMP/thiamine import ATP-binding protein YkoD n=1 Tax=Microbacterium laevaniformans TaxID=36807 RepID=A0A150HFH7_9MICO|nr:ABC transporter ATP-binding protein [Microbacterium laevaniformans]KXZ60795.1 putative HMP/thiamine import ATP-binding protein YkoD [Microbacterium laevaniformans]